MQTDWGVGWGPPARKTEGGFKTAPASTGVFVVVFLGLIFLVQGHWAGVPNVGLGPHSLMRASAIVIFRLFVGLPPRGTDLDSTISPPSYLCCFGFFTIYLVVAGLFW